MTQIRDMIQAEAYLNRIPMWAAKKNSLADIRAFLAKMGNPDEGMRILHVAGTNGKGSVCAYLASMLCEAGCQVGAFVSPHLVHVRERFLFGLLPVEEELFLDGFARVKALAERRGAEGFAPPTYFEFLFYMFMSICERKKPDFVILETGLGGLLDTTNVVRRPVMTVITSISMDHMQYLGSTLKEIGAQKAGILKAGIPVVYDSTCPESREVVEERAGALGCPAFPLGEKDYTLIKRDKGGTRILVRTGGEDLEVLLSSQADYQMINAAVAARAVWQMRAVDVLAITSGQMRAGLERCFWPGRMEEVLPGLYLDGAHNRGGMEALARNARRMQRETGKAVSLMFSASSDKEYHRMIETLCRDLTVSHVVIAHMDTRRSEREEALAEEFEKYLDCPVNVFSTVKEAWAYFLNRQGDSLAFCTGSLYLVGEVKALLDC